MAITSGIPIVFISAMMLDIACGSIWTIHYRSHPYKTEVYTAEFIQGMYRYYWCADTIRLEDAVVLCNQASQHNGLGPYNLQSAAADHAIEFGALHYDPAVPEAFTNETFDCAGTESRLSDCPRRAVTEPCPSENIGQVDCKPADNAGKNLTVKLTSMPHLAEMGVVEVENPDLRGMAGLVCDEDGRWGHDEATVVCKSLGFDHGWPVHAPAVAELPSLPQSYVMKNVRCQGTEASINECPHTDMCMAIDFLSKNFVCPESCEGDTASVVCG